MKHASLLVAAVTVASAWTHAATIEATDITDGTSTFTTADTLVTITPYSSVAGAGTVGVFGVGPNFFGVGGDNKVADVDGDPATTGDREAIDISLDPTVGLSGMSLRWTRAAGAAPDGVVISGFLADPGATTASGVGITYSSGSLFLNYAWDAGTIRSFDFSNPSASFGQTLRVGVNDVDNAGPQVTINTISYVPEPSIALLGGLGLLGLLRRRR